MSGPDIARTRFSRAELACGELHRTQEPNHDQTFEERGVLFDATKRKGEKASLFLARAREIACTAFERAMLTIYIEKGKSSGMSRAVPWHPAATNADMLKGAERRVHHRWIQLNSGV